jgi:hypothetical protein
VFTLIYSRNVELLQGESSTARDAVIASSDLCHRVCVKVAWTFRLHLSCGYLTIWLKDLVTAGVLNSLTFAVVVVYPVLELACIRLPLLTAASSTDNENAVAHHLAMNPTFKSVACRDWG